MNGKCCWKKLLFVCPSTRLARQRASGHSLLALASNVLLILELQTRGISNNQDMCSDQIVNILLIARLPGVFDRPGTLNSLFVLIGFESISHLSIAEIQ